MQQIPVPFALKQLILANNTLLKRYQQQLTYEIEAANQEIMELLAINNPSWKLDMDNMVYVRLVESSDTIST
jgi:hypothetical protein